MGTERGKKLYRYLEDSDNPEIIRILNINYDKNIVKYKTESGERKKGDYKNIKRDYRTLAPDGEIIFTVCKIGIDSDVIVAMQSFMRLEEEYDRLNKKYMPYVVCRQLVADVFSNMANPDNVVIGASISVDTCPPNIDYACLLASDGVDYTNSIAIYKDDTLEDILSLFDNKPYDDALLSLEPAYGQVNGYCHSLKELLESNNFMYDFRKCFNIMEIPFEINEEDIEEGHLDFPNTEYLAKELKVNIQETYLVRYSREINFSKIKRDYVLVASAKENYANLYLVGYDVLKR